MANFSVEEQIRVFDDRDGCFISVGTDADGLDLVEIRQCDEKYNIQARITMSIEQARLVSGALAKYLSRLQQPHESRSPE